MSSTDAGSSGVSSWSPSPVWSGFAGRLASVLQALQEDQFLVVSAKKSSLYVQLACQGFYGLRMETTSNQYLSETEQLTDMQINMLADLGWNRPAEEEEDEVRDKPPEGSPNFHIDFSTPVSFDGAAELAVKTLSLVHRIPHPGYLEYEAFDSDGNSIPIPDLGLKRMTRYATPDPQKMRQTLLSTIREFTRLSDLNYDRKGNIGIRFGSVVTFISYMEKPPSVRFHSPLVTEIKESPELNARLNELNSGTWSMHFFHRNNTIQTVSDIPAAPFSADHIIQALTMFNEIADGMDDILAAEFGGKTAFAGTMPTLVTQ